MTRLSGTAKKLSASDPVDLDLIGGLLFAPAFTLWGAPATWLELLAFGLALAMVGCNIREIHWGWPLAIISSLLYFGVFWRSKLYGDAALKGGGGNSAA